MQNDDGSLQGPTMNQDFPRHLQTRLPGAEGKPNYESSSQRYGFVSCSIVHSIFHEGYQHCAQLGRRTARRMTSTSTLPLAKRALAEAGVTVGVVPQFLQFNPSSFGDPLYGITSRQSFCTACPNSGPYFGSHRIAASSVLLRMKAVVFSGITVNPV